MYRSYLVGSLKAGFVESILAFGVRLDSSWVCTTLRDNGKSNFFRFNVLQLLCPWHWEHGSITSLRNQKTI